MKYTLHGSEIALIHIIIQCRCVYDNLDSESIHVKKNLVFIYTSSFNPFNQQFDIW